MKTIKELKSEAMFLRLGAITPDVYRLAVFVSELTEIIEEQQKQIKDLTGKGVAKYE